MDKNKIVLSWSGGKDSALSLFRIMDRAEFEISSLLTTVTSDYGRISMHGVREELLREQARRASVALDIAYISKDATNEEYERIMSERTKRYLENGIEGVVFGDLFLEDVRSYREERMSTTGMKCLFPLWGENTTKLAREFIRLGFKALVCTIDPGKLGKEFAGKEFNEEFLSSLPSSVDPCGENGEFHTFVYDGPVFDSPIPVRKGEIVLREGLYFADILMAES